MARRFQPVWNTGIDLVWEQSSGNLYLSDSENVRALIARGYSGALGAQNDTSREKEKGVGPIPRGVWQLHAPVARHARLGPTVIGLSPVGHDAFGRSGFFIHGDNADGDASEGCIVLSRLTRDVIAALYWAGVRHVDVV